MPTPNSTDAALFLSPSPTPSSPSSLSSSSSSNNNKWGPYSSGKDFAANMAMVLAVVLCITILGFFLTTAIHAFLRRRRRMRVSGAEAEMQKPSRPAPAIDALPPSLVFSAGTRLAGAEAECAICLAEFVEGDRVRVLPACKHGFHAGCIEAWLGSSSSCPTCRSSCRPSVEPSQSLPEEP